MSETRTLLPGEGETRTQVRVRQSCAQCGEPATVRIGFLLENFRSNPASAGYGRDDCTYCDDTERFACDDHVRIVEQLDGYEAGSWLRLNDRNASRFLAWEPTR